MTTRIHSQSSAVPFVLTALSIPLCIALYVVAGSAGVVIFAWSVPFALWFLWAARNVETLEERFALRPARAGSTSTRSATPSGARVGGHANKTPALSNQ